MSQATNSSADIFYAILQSWKMEYTSIMSWNLEIVFPFFWNFSGFAWTLKSTILCASLLDFSSSPGLETRNGATCLCRTKRVCQRCTRTGTSFDRTPDTDGWAWNFDFSIWILNISCCRVWSLFVRGRLDWPQPAGISIRDARLRNSSKETASLSCAVALNFEFLAEWHCPHDHNNRHH